MRYGKAGREYSETVPVQYEDGFSLFMGMRIKVDPRVLIPRPETEILVRTAVDELSRSSVAEPKVVDMCTGSGAVAIAISRMLPGAKIKAVDVSSEALQVAVENVGVFDLSDRIRTFASDMFSGFSSDDEEAYDAVVSNPPYVSDRDFEFLDPWVKAEPEVALRGGREGLDFLEILCEESGKFIRKGGFLALEVGYDQSRKVRDKMAENGFSRIEAIRDGNGFNRVVIGRKNG